MIRRAGDMKMSAYDKSYLDSMLQKNRYLFRLIGRNCENPFQIITEYMKGKDRKHMDEGNPLYLNKTPKQILGGLGIRLEAENHTGSYDEFILDWMADIYTYLQWEYEIFSEELVEKITPGELYKKYYPLHETSIENGARKLMKIFYNAER